MTQTTDTSEFQARLQRLDALLADAGRLADPATRAVLQQIVRAILELHTAGLRCLLEVLSHAGDAGKAVLNACTGDERVAGLLLLHGLHPHDTETRVQQALEQVRPYLGSHGGRVELLGVHAGIVRLRMEGSCNGCPSSAVTIKQTIEEAIYSRAPDVTAVEVEGTTAAPTSDHDGRFHVALPLV